MSKPKPMAAMIRTSHCVRLREEEFAGGDEDTEDSTKRGEGSAPAPQQLFEQQSGRGLFYGLVAGRGHQVEHFFSQFVADVVLLQGLTEVGRQRGEVLRPEPEPVSRGALAGAG